jgi:hypothetical protein
MSPLVHMFEETVKGLAFFFVLFFVFLCGSALAFHSEMSMFSETNRAFDTVGRSLLSTFSIAMGETDVTGLDVNLSLQFCYYSHHRGLQFP